MKSKTVNLFQYKTSCKSGRSIVELRFSVKSDRDLINNDVDADLLIAQTMKPHEITAIACNLMNSYKFTRKQQNQILENPPLMNTFIKLHTEFYHGKRVAKNPTAYMAQALGFGKDSSGVDKPATKARKTTRHEPKQLGMLITDIVNESK